MIRSLCSSDKSIGTSPYLISFMMSSKIESSSIKLSLIMRHACLPWTPLMWITLIKHSLKKERVSLLENSLFYFPSNLSDSSKIVGTRSRFALELRRYIVETVRLMMLGLAPVFSATLSLGGRQAKSTIWLRQIKAASRVSVCRPVPGTPIRIKLLPPGILSTLAILVIPINISLNSTRSYLAIGCEIPLTTSKPVP